MRIVTYLEQDIERIGLFLDGLVFPCHLISKELPTDLLSILQQGDAGLAQLHNLNQKIISDNNLHSLGIPIDQLQILAPLPNPPSFRDAYAFRQHVETSRSNRGLEMIPEFDQFPVFYFSNHQAIQGGGEVKCMPRHFEHLDFELEVAIIIHKKGRNIKASEADDYIAGLMILNDISARTLQMEEMKLNLGPAKGKDFASAFGPYLVTMDELISYKSSPKEGHIGAVYDLKMSCSVNGIQVSSGSLADMHWTFAEIIERVSYGVTLYPGDIIGSGTVGTGCFLELNGTGKRKDPNYQEQWLQKGDEVEMEVTGLGKLSNTFIEE